MGLFRRTPPPESTEGQAEQPKPGLFGRVLGALSDKIKKTRDQLVGQVREALKAASIVDEAALEGVEEALLRADLGPETVNRLVSNMREFEARGATVDELMAAFRRDLLSIIDAPTARPVQWQPKTGETGPRVILVIGVNGSGKTTTIGKLAQHLRAQGLTVMLAAGDTFRAAAIDQLKIWAERTGSHFVGKDPGSDPSAVAFQGVTEAVQAKVDVLLIDTAGRLHTKTNLMDELRKTVRVIKKVVPDAPHETILVLDATTGQNAVSQAKAFTEAVPVDGIVMTKLDGTAKGGALIGVRHAVSAPVVKIGIGEGAEDLRDFNAQEFVAALFGDE